MTTGRQIAAARALLGMTEAELAEATGLSLMELRRIEVRSDEADNDDGAVASVKSALEDAGISFIDPRASSAAGGEGIRLSAPSSASVDTNDDETVQYPEMAQNGPFGAGG